MKLLLSILELIRNQLSGGLSWLSDNFFWFLNAKSLGF